MRRVATRSLLVVAAMTVLWSCNTAPSTEADRKAQSAEVEGAVEVFKAKDPGMSRFFDSAKGYAVFPSVGKGAIGVGGAYGRGQLFEGEVMVGYCDLTQGTIGLQLGGQAYREIIFFQNDKALSDFKSGHMELSAQASAVAVESGASTTADYMGGVAVFTMAKSGLMYEASIGGQQFTFVAK